MNVQVKAYAKLNLTLDIIGSEGGYHLIDSVVTTVDIFDLINVSKRKDKEVTVTMHGLNSESIPFEENNAVKAAKAFIQKFGTCGADITVYKNIPIGAGLGGSSADAAGVINAMKALYQIHDKTAVKDLADSLGSDTGYMLTGGYARISGRGERIKRIESDLCLDFLLFIPKQGVSTAECYARYDILPKQAGIYSGNVENALKLNDLKGVCKNLDNALFGAASSLSEGVQTSYSEALAFNPEGVNMTGSGCAVYAIFQNAEFCRWAQSRYYGNAKLIQTKTVNPNKKGKNLWQKKD